MADGIEIKGADKIAAKLRQLTQLIPNEVARALYEEANIEATESRRRTPVDTGALRASHHVQRPKVSFRDVSVDIVVGGPAAPYALQVHEDLEAFHRVGQAKFLESTIRESAPHMAARIARRIALERLI